jgi:hypothetical protein
VSKSVTKEYKSCPICGPGTISKRPAALKKNIMENHGRKRLSVNHPWRSMLGFDGSVDFDMPIVPTTRKDGWIDTNII